MKVMESSLSVFRVPGHSVFIQSHILTDSIDLAILLLLEFFEGIVAVMVNEEDGCQPGEK